jgi:hypothetical protein
MDRVLHVLLCLLLPILIIVILLQEATALSLLRYRAVAYKSIFIAGGAVEKTRPKKSITDMLKSGAIAEIPTICCANHFKIMVFGE